ncbi:MAG: universal stress protein [Verrucomicrobiales bacterium]
MPDFDQVIAGTDFSECARRAVVEGSRIARASGTPLHLVHIVDPGRIEYIQDFASVSTDEILENARGQLKEIAAPIRGDGLDISLEVVIGHPLEELLRMTQAHSGALLVLGAHGYHEQRQATGTLSVKCVRKAEVPVLLVREAPKHPYGKVAACVDFSDTSLEALHLAASIANTDGAVLEILHVHYPPWKQPVAVQYNLAASPDAEYRTHYEGFLADKLESTAQKIRSEFPDLTVNTHLIERSHPAYGIVDFLAESKADLAVTGTRGRKGLRAMLLGTTAERILHECPCSLVAVKPEGFTYPHR